jgi:peptidoglycan/LPS O-acetylase OafA/YrhL
MRLVPVSAAHDTGLRRISARWMTTVLAMSAGRSPDVRPVEAMRLMAAVAGVIAAIAGVVGLSRDDGQLTAVGVAFAALALYLYARWRDVVGRGNTALLGAAVVVCAAACIGLALTGYWWFALCLSVPTVFALIRFSGRRG